MFAVIYHWKLKEGENEEEFRSSWHEGTLNIYKTYGSFGSSLHKMIDGTFIAYARWPNRDTWQKMMTDTNHTSRNRKFVDSLEPPIELELIDDQLKIG